MKNLCHARRTNGQPCHNSAILGATVCRVHGGAAKQVREAARQRLEELVLPAIATLRRLVASAETDAVSLAAAKDILDRTGHRPADKLEQASDVRITVTYEDVGPAPMPDRSNGHALGNGRSNGH